MSKVSIGILLSIWVILTSCRKNEYTENAVLVMARALHYMKRNAKDMNVDAVFGLVLAEANIQSLLRENVPKKYLAKVRLLEYITNETIHEIRPHLEKNFKNTLFVHTILVVEAWRKIIRFGAVPLKMTYFYKKFSNINTLNKYLDYLKTSTAVEKDSDDCLIELLNQQRSCCKKHNCSISSKCQKLMLRDLGNIDPAYGVTHNLLYIQIARSQKCYLNESILKTKINEYCSYIYWEASKNYKYGFLEKLDDLFLEQVTLCGYEGFTEFLKDDFIEHILSLQTDDGCFKLYRSAVDKLPLSKRETNLLDNDCTDHTTGLGVSALSIILRYQLSTI